MKKRVFFFNLVFVFLMVMFCTVNPVLAEGDTDTDEAGDDDVNYEVSLTESDSKFEPDLILPGILNQCNLWKLTRLIEKGSINYEKTVTIINSGEADVTFDDEDIIVNIKGEESGEELGIEYFEFDGLEDKTFEPNREFQVNVTLLAEKLRKNKITPDKYSGYFKIWVNEMNDYLKVPVEISLKSPIWIPILVLFIAALAVPLGKALVAAITLLETKVKYDKLYKRVRVKGRKTVGVKWFKDYLKYLHEKYKSGGSDKKTFEDQLELVKKMLVLLDFEKDKKVYETIEKIADENVKAEQKGKLLAEYKKLENATDSDVDAKIQEVKESILKIVNPQALQVKDRAKLQAMLKVSRKPFRYIYQWLSLWWAGGILIFIIFISWLFVTAILIFWGLSEQYTEAALWGVNPIKDWGAIFTWVFSSSLTTTSVKDLIEDKILSKGSG